MREILEAKSESPEIPIPTNVHRLKPGKVRNAPRQQQQRQIEYDSKLKKRRWWWIENREIEKIEYETGCCLGWKLSKSLLCQIIVLQVKDEFKCKTIKHGIVDHGLQTKR